MFKLIIATGLISLLAACGSMSPNTSSTSMSDSNTAVMGAGPAAGGPVGPTRFGPN